MLNSKCVMYKSAIEEVSIWGWPLQTAGLFHTGFFSSSFTVLSGRVTEVTKSNICSSTALPFTDSFVNALFVWYPFV